MCDIEGHKYREIDQKNITEQDECLYCLWGKLGDVPIDENEDIEVDFHIWEKGTDRMELWRWFDNQIPVYELMKHNTG